MTFLDEGSSWIHITCTMLLSYQYFNYATLALSYPSVSTVFISALKYLFYIYGLIQITVVDVVGGVFFCFLAFLDERSSWSTVLSGLLCYLVNNV